MPDEIWCQDWSGDVRASSFQLTINTASMVPEPTSPLLLCVGGLALGLAGRRHRR